MKPEDTKRFCDIWRGDDDFRREFRERPGAALKEWGLPPGAAALHSFCIEQEEEGGRLAGLAELPGMESYRAFLEEKNRCLEKHYVRGISNPAFNNWRLRQISRFRTQVPDDWSHRNPHLPFVVELTNGCSLACPFCAGAARRLDGNIPPFGENSLFFTELLRRLQKTVGLDRAPGLLYFFTEPFDHPDYEKYLAEAARIWGMAPQTTTAAWFRDEQRTRRFLEFSAKLGMPYNRFSINSKKLFQRCLARFSPRELLNIQLILNYPEAAGVPLYASGRGKRMDNTVQGSVACVSGFLFNLALGRIQLVSPTIESQRWPHGYRILEEAFIASLDDLERFLHHCRQIRFNSVLNDRSPLELRSDLQLARQGTSWFLINSYRRFPLSDGEKSMLELLPQAKTVQELLRHEIPGLTPTQVFKRLTVWWNNGILDDQTAKHPDAGAKQQGGIP